MVQNAERRRRKKRGVKLENKKKAKRRVKRRGEKRRRGGETAEKQRIQISSMNRKLSFFTQTFLYKKILIRTRIIITDVCF